MKIIYLCIIAFFLIAKINSQNTTLGFRYIKTTADQTKPNLIILNHKENNASIANNTLPKKENSTEIPQKLNYQKQIAEDQSSEPSGGTITLFIILGIVIIALIVGGIYFWMKWKEKQLIHDYAMNPEKFMPKPQLSMLQKLSANNFQFNTKPNFITEGVICKKEHDQSSSWMKVIFQQKDQLYHSIIGTKYIDFNRDNIYFEITVDGFQDPDFDIVIGFATEKSFNKEQAVGDSANSVGFHTNSCSVRTGNATKINYGEKYGYNCLYGDTIGFFFNLIIIQKGIGYRTKDGRVWFTYNGQFLNEMMSTEKKQAKKNEKKDSKKNTKKKETEKKEELTEEQKKEIIEKDKELKEQIIQLQFPERVDIYPVISAKTPVMLTLNFGAKNFMLFQKEIAKGLL